jgi:hypothetical protein
MFVGLATNKASKNQTITEDSPTLIDERIMVRAS